MRLLGKGCALVTFEAGTVAKKRPADHAGLSHRSLSEFNGLGICRAV